MQLGAALAMCFFLSCPSAILPEFHLCAMKDSSSSIFITPFLTCMRMFWWTMVAAFTFHRATPTSSVAFLLPVLFFGSGLQCDYLHFRLVWEFAFFAPGRRYHAARSSKSFLEASFPNPYSMACLLSAVTILSHYSVTPFFTSNRFHNWGSKPFYLFSRCPF